MRIGVLTDLHAEREPPRERAWINRYDPAGIERRLTAALGHFSKMSADLIVLLGDVTERADEVLLAELFDRVVDAALPTAAVPGNHDCRRTSDDFAAVAATHSVARPAIEPQLYDGVALAGIDVEQVQDCPSMFRSSDGSAERAVGALLVASHFPILSEAGRLAAAGLPYPGDLVDRQTIAARLRGGSPVVVLSGHIHARCSRADGPILQLSFGSLIEPPFDCAIVEISRAEPLLVRRRSERLGPRASVEPVFVGEDEAWEWRDRRWRRVGEASTRAPGPRIAPTLSLDHCVIAVSDRARADRFYREVLGAEILSDRFGRTAYRFGEQQLNVHDGATDVGSLVAARPVVPGNSDLCFVWHGSIDDAIAHVDRCGVTIEAGPVPRDGAQGEGESIYFRDPDGSLLEFIAYG